LPTSTLPSSSTTLPPWFLHGAAVIVGEYTHLTSLALHYGFRPEVNRQSDDEACCLLVASLPPSSAFRSTSSCLTTITESLLSSLASYGPPSVVPKEEVTMLGHHLQTILRRGNLTRERVSQEAWKKEKHIMREPALLAIGQEWPERFTIDVFGGKREVGESSLQAAVRETKEESGDCVCLEQEEEEERGKGGRRYVRIPGLDFWDESMAFWGFLCRGEGVGEWEKEGGGHGNLAASGGGGGGGQTWNGRGGGIGGGGGGGKGGSSRFGAMRGGRGVRGGRGRRSERGIFAYVASGDREEHLGGSRRVGGVEGRGRQRG